DVLHAVTRRLFRAAQDPHRRARLTQPRHDQAAEGTGAARHQDGRAHGDLRFVCHVDRPCGVFPLDTGRRRNVTGMDERTWLTETFEEQRPRLRAVAYRMLGSLSEAEDAVQEAWLRLSGTAHGEIDELGAWLTT